ncbi:DNA-formamidopyrimidine glycosylase family protein, partial [Rhizobium leguminosarum]|uniref:DNA-formamidopyrimidine glycosylase family protein n=1 Tax=Rhizobium leguminosarum TaxID=384 RepID=UPI003F9A74B6
MEGTRVTRLELRRGDLRFPFPDAFAERVSGRTIVGLGRRAKYLLVDLDDGNTLISESRTSADGGMETAYGFREVPDGEKQSL